MPRGVAPLPGKEAGILTPSPPAPAAHHFSVDVEEYFHPTALAEVIPSTEWDRIPRRSSSLLPPLLDLLEEHGVRGTFFVLGWLAEREPDLVKEIHGRGHEIASHGWGHQKVTELTQEEFRTDVTRTRDLLQELTGEEVWGYRAPSFSIRPGMEWAFDILLEEGYRYDSSTFPVRVHPGYGYTAGGRDPWVMQRSAGRLAEFPLTTWKVAGLDLPAAGGAYLRFFPVALIRNGLRSSGARGVPGTFYMHPWETDRDLPKFDAPALTQLRMRGGIRRVARRLRSLLRDFGFRPMRQSAGAMLSESPR